LDQSVIEEIVRKEILEFNKQLAEKNVRVEVTPHCVRWLAEKGYSPEFGARNMARLVEEKIKTFFVDEVLFGDLSEGGVAVADVEDDDIVVRVKHEAEA
jgi:ATP-dependent Clp protease ATP-binding subunit ClpA